MNFAVEFVPQAKADLLRLFQCLLDRAETVADLDVAERAIAAIEIRPGAPVQDAIHLSQGSA